MNTKKVSLFFIILLSSLIVGLIYFEKQKKEEKFQREVRVLIQEAEKSLEESKAGISRVKGKEFKKIP